MLLEDRVAIVSGIGPGLGRAIALALAREGASLVLGARTEDNLAKVATEIEALDRPVAYVPTDVTDEDQCAALAQAAVDRFGRLDVLVNNAFMQPPLEPTMEATSDTWRTAMEVNVIGSVQMTKAAAPHLREGAHGAVVFVNSMSARRVRERFGVYSATKSALLTAARHLAKELGPDGVRVNSVVPGYIWGPSLEWWFGYQAEQRGVTTQDVYDEVAAGTCLHHLPTSEEVADAVVFLASDLARAITGQSLDVNGGHWFH